MDNPPLILFIANCYLMCCQPEDDQTDDVALTEIVDYLVFAMSFLTGQLCFIYHIHFYIIQNFIYLYYIYLEFHKLVVDSEVEIDWIKREFNIVGYLTELLDNFESLYRQDESLVNAIAGALSDYKDALRHNNARKYLICLFVFCFDLYD